MMRKASNFRWMVCSLLFFATMVNYLDRQVLSLTWKDFIAPGFHWTDNDYGTITACFSLVYAVCNLFAGRFVDWLGTRRGYLWAIFIWSAAACLHALCGHGTVLLVDGIASVEALHALESGSAIALSVASVSVWLFLGCRCFLALGEAGNFPAAIKVTAEYFPKKDRAFATSVFNAGSSIGALIAPVTIPPIAQKWGWEAAFVAIGALGFVWMGFWQFLYRSPDESAHVNAEELAYITCDEGSGTADGREACSHASENTIGFLRLFSFRQTWAIVIVRLLTDGGWWFFLFWTPGYLSDQFGYTSASGMGMALVMTIYIIVTGLSVWLCRLPGRIMGRLDAASFEARLSAMLLYAALPLLALFVQPLGRCSAWFPAILIGIVCAGHQAWSANTYSIVGDLFPKSTIATLTGIAQFAGGIGCFVVNKASGMLFTFAERQGNSFSFCGFDGKSGGYMIVFCWCAISYIMGWFCLKFLTSHQRFASKACSKSSCVSNKKENKKMKGNRK